MANIATAPKTEAEKPVASTIVISGQTVNVRTFKAGRVVIDLPADFMKGGTGPRWIPVGGLNPDGLQVFMTCGITRKEPKAPRE
jgi:hypothetical protein